jgi:hypothetical protein
MVLYMDDELYAPMMVLEVWLMVLEARMMVWRRGEDNFKNNVKGVNDRKNPVCKS